MSEGELSAKDSDGGENKGSKKSAGGPRMGGKFRAPSSSKVSGPAYIPDDDDELVDEVAKRFRSGPRLGAPVLEGPSLDKEDFDGDEVDDESLLDALDSVPQKPKREPFPTEAGILRGRMNPAREPGAKIEDSEVLPTVDVEPVSDGPASVAEGPAIVCPSCRAENPSGMRFCVECGGSLEAPKVADAGSQVPGGAVDREPPPPSKAAQEESPWEMSLVCINEDGSDGKAIPLEYLETTMGRDADDRFPTDAFLSPKHARFHIEDGALYVEDLYSLNGTFIKLREETRLTPGDTILMGRQVLRFERFEQSITPKTKSSDGTRYMGSPAPGGSFKVLQIGIGGVVQNVYCLPEAGAVLGREKGDIVFPHDKFMSGRHAQIYTGDDGHCYLVDLNSSNGTWNKIWEKTKLDDADFMFMGQQLFRVQSDD